MTDGGCPAAGGPVRVPALVVLASGNGSNAQALIDACASGRLAARVAVVITDVAGAGVLARAERVGVATVVLERVAGEHRADYDARLAEAVASRDPDWIVLAGWMRLLTMGFLGRFPRRVVNLHPALPGELPGTRAIERAWHESRAGTRTRTGVMVHLVPDEGVDDGPVLATREVPIDRHESLASLEARVHAVEHDLLVTTLARLVATRPALVEQTLPSSAAPPTVPAPA